MENFEVDFFIKDDGSCPVAEFLDSLDGKMQAKLLRILELLELYGNILREPYSKFVGDGIFEVRAKQGSDITRVLYFFVADRKIILTNGFAKKSQKTPSREIELAQKYRDLYYKRKENSDE